MKPARPLTPAAVCVIFLLNTVSGFFPRAQNLTWKSTNFKTILTWGPNPRRSTPTLYSTLLVQWYGLCHIIDSCCRVGQDKQRNPLCFRSSATLCDLSTFLTDLHANYTADVLSEPPLGVTSDLIEFPYTTSPRFCPYKDNGRQLSIRDVFSDQLQYRVTYRRSTSTGKKTKNFKTNVIEMQGLDQRDSYCFNVQAFIPSRSFSKQLGEMSHTQCSRDLGQVYSVGTIAGAIVLILLLIAIIIAITVICCKRRRKTPTTGKGGHLDVGHTSYCVIDRAGVELPGLRYTAPVREGRITDHPAATDN
ncbi:hypothetical protein INR49_018994, partial [Caranx melampygus]